MSHLGDMSRPRPFPAVVALHSRIFAAGFKPVEVLRRSGVRTSTWTRLSKGAEPKQATIDKLDAALADLIVEDAQGRG